MQQIVSKSQFKPKVLAYLRKVEKGKKPLIITHGGKPVVKLIPYSEDPQATLNELKGTVLQYQDPTEPVDKNLWEQLK